MKHVVNTVRPWQLMLFLAPAVIVYSLFSALPLVQTLGQGFFSADDNGIAVFVGLENFRTILLDPDWSAGFWNAMANNAKFFCIHMLLQNPIGLLLATLFSLKGLRGARTLPHADLFADTAVGGDHRLYLAADPVAAVGRGRKADGLCRPGRFLRAVDGAGRNPRCPRCR